MIYTISHLKYVRLDGIGASNLKLEVNFNVSGLLILISRLQFHLNE